MKFTDICIITNQVLEVTKFYETIFQAKAKGDFIHSSINAAGLSIAIYNKREAESVMGFDFTNSGAGRLSIGFNVDDIDAEYKRIKALDVKDVTVPQLWPWGESRFILVILRVIS